MFVRLPSFLLALAAGSLFLRASGSDMSVGATPPPARLNGLLAEGPDALAALGGLPWIDAVGWIAVGVLALLGLYRGLWWQVVGLLGLASAVGVARTFGHELTPHVRGWIPDLDPRIAQGVAWIAVFLGTLAAAILVGRLGHRILAAAHLGLLDRFGGALAGGLTGMLLHAAFLAAISQLGPADWVRGTLRGTQSERLLDACGRRWPVVLAEGAGDALWTAPGAERPAGASGGESPVEPILGGGAPAPDAAPAAPPLEAVDPDPDRDPGPEPEVGAEPEPGGVLVPRKSRVR